MATILMRDWAVIDSYGYSKQYQSGDRDTLIWRLQEFYDVTNVVVIPWQTYIDALQYHTSQELYNIYGGSKVYDKLPHVENEDQPYEKD
jgi:hypothetical protein